MTDEEIESTYFPGTVPVLPDPTEAHLESLRFTDDGWESTLQGVLFVIAGSAQQPDPECLHLAKLVINRFAEVEASSKQLARTFMHDEGSWSVDAIDFAEQAGAKQCDFLVDMSFSPKDGSNKYGYTSFAACFAVTEGSAPGKANFHVKKYVVEFV